MYIYIYIYIYVYRDIYIAQNRSIPLILGPQEGTPNILSPALPRVSYIPCKQGFDLRHLARGAPSGAGLFEVHVDSM